MIINSVEIKRIDVDFEWKEQYIININGEGHGAKKTLKEALEVVSNYETKQPLADDYFENWD